MDRKQKLLALAQEVLKQSPDLTPDEVAKKVEAEIMKSDSAPEGEPIPEAPNAVKADIETEVQKALDERALNERIEEGVNKRWQELVAKRNVIHEDIEIAKRQGDPTKGGREFSIAKAIAANSPWGCRDAELERKYMEKALSTEVDSDGGYLAPVETLSQILDKMYPMTVLDRAGVTRIPMGAQVTQFPTLETGASVTFGHKQGATIATATTPTWGARKLVARKATCLFPIPNDMIKAVGPETENFIRNHVAKQLALAYDRTGIVGDGVLEPLGIYNQASIASKTSKALADLNQDELREQKLAVMLGDSNMTAWITHPSVLDRISGIRDSQQRPVMNPDPTQPDRELLHGYPILASTQVKVDATTWPLMAGDWSQMYAGTVGGLQLQADYSVGFKEDVTWLRGILQFDFVVGVAAAFSKREVTAT